MGQCLDIFTRTRNNNTRAPELSVKASNAITSTQINNQTYTVSSDPNETGLYFTTLMMSSITDPSPEQTLTQDIFKSMSDSGTENAE